jgi:hypothetical protein
MKKVSLSLLLGATLVATIVPATASAAGPFPVPGCFLGMTPDFVSNHPIPGTIAVGNDNDPNGDGVLCYHVFERKHGKPAIVVYTENRNRRDPWDPFAE